MALTQFLIAVIRLDTKAVSTPLSLSISPCLFKTQTNCCGILALVDKSVTETSRGGLGQLIKKKKHSFTNSMPCEPEGWFCREALFASMNTETLFPVGIYDDGCFLLVKNPHECVWYHVTIHADGVFIFPGSSTMFA